MTAVLEPLLSSVTEFAYYAVKMQISYSICINVRTAGHTPFYFIPKGEGKEHLQKVLEVLASINTHHSIFPYEKMLSFYHRHLAKQPYFLHAGRSTPASNDVIINIANQGIRMMELKVEKDHGRLKVLETHHGQRGLL